MKYRNATTKRTRWFGPIVLGLALTACTTTRLHYVEPIANTEILPGGAEDWCASVREQWGGIDGLLKLYRDNSGESAEVFVAEARQMWEECE